jgi:hypothetical protein
MNKHSPNIIFLMIIGDKPGQTRFQQNIKREASSSSRRKRFYKTGISKSIQSQRGMKGYTKKENWRRIIKDENHEENSES